MEYCTLHTVEMPGWQNERDHDREVHDALTRAMSHVAPGQTPDFLAAEACIAAVKDTCMSARQRIRVLYLTAQAQAAREQTYAALATLDDALALAMETEEHEATVELLHLRGILHRRISYFEDAVADCHDCLAILRAHREMSHAQSVDTWLAMFVQLGSFEFALAHYDAAEVALMEARLLAPAATQSAKELATIEWMQAMLDRWRDQPEAALVHAAEAAHFFAGADSPINAGRIQQVMADILVDIALRREGSRDALLRETLLELARRHAALAAEYAARAGDSVGSQVTALIQLRLRRAAGIEEDRLPAIEDAMRAALELGDVSTLAMAQTTMGDELAARGERAAAISWYRRVLDTAAESQTPALARWAQQAIFQWEEHATPDRGDA